MDEKELVRRIKQSLAIGKSDTEILQILQSQGYRLEYATVLLQKAKRPKRVFKSMAVFGVIIVLLALSAFFGGYLLTTTEPIQGSGSNSGGTARVLRSPLDGFRVIFEPKDSEASVSLQSLSSNESAEGIQDIYIEDVVVTTEFITYLMYGLGANKLHKNPLTGNKPILNFNIEGTGFHAIVDKGNVMSYDGLHENPDITFTSTKLDFVKAMVDPHSVVVFKESYNVGTTTLDIHKNEVSLGAKGYLGFYESLNA